VYACARVCVCVCVCVCSSVCARMYVPSCVPERACTSEGSTDTMREEWNNEGSPERKRRWLHCCDTVFTLLSQCCHTIVTLLLRCFYFTREEWNNEVSPICVTVVLQ
jgi:hypothetical protein